MADALTDRIVALKEFCGRHDFEFRQLTGTQRDPGDGVVVKVGGIALTSLSQDSMTVAIAQMETTLMALRRASGDVYLLHPAPTMGRLA